MEQEQLSQKFQQGRISLLNVVAGVVVLIILVFFGYFKYQEYLLTTEIKTISDTSVRVAAEIDQLQKKNLSEIFVAFQTVEALNKKSFTWSTFVTLLAKVTPADVFYSSYGVSQDGKVSISALAPSFVRVAELIRVLHSQPAFSDIFVPSLSRGRDRGQNEVVSFSVSMDYSQLQSDKLKRSVEPQESQEAEFEQPPTQGQEPADAPTQPSQPNS